MVLDCNTTRGVRGIAGDVVRSNRGRNGVYQRRRRSPTLGKPAAHERT